MFSLARRLLFLLPPERAHDLTFATLDRYTQLTGGLGLPKPIADPRALLGLTCRNAVGLSAGLDKNADHVLALAALGFGFLELGTVTPRPQPGNPGPRLFRLPAHQALINRLGFNNLGVEHLCQRLAATRSQLDLPIGINIGKNRDTPLEQATQDYRHCLKAVYPFADYIAVNLSSPNTPGLRALQAGEQLVELVRALKADQKQQTQASGRYVPLLVKIAPDLSPEALHDLVDVLMGEAIDGVIATNTTLSREPVAGAKNADEAGGLSGAPLLTMANAVVEQIRSQSGPDWPIIGAGGITQPQDAVTKMQAGADLVQVYTGLIYQGPKLIQQAAAAIRDQVAH